MQFRKHKITRNCKKQYVNYQDYKPYLAEDFHHRCAYCNLLDDNVTSFFEVDHFVPQAEIKKDARFSYLTTDYDNLIYSCRNCNGEKSNLYEGDISKSPYENQRFYDPVKTDYNTIFYRNECGTICSDDSKGKSMIIDLKLYRPINNLAWICEQLNELSDKLHALQLAETDPERKALIKDAEIEALRYYKDCQQIHTANFNNKSFSIMDIDL